MAEKIEHPYVQKSAWNSLEVVKILTSILTPLALLWIGSQWNYSSMKNAQAREKESQVIRKRIELWDKVGKDIHDIYSYFLRTGNVAGFDC
jgi:hypothetical protein